MFKKLGDLFSSKADKGIDIQAGLTQNPVNNINIRISSAKLVADIISSSPELTSINFAYTDLVTDIITHHLLSDMSGMDELSSEQIKEMEQSWRDSPEVVEWVTALIKQDHTGHYINQQSLKIGIEEMRDMIMKYITTGKIDDTVLELLNIMASYEGNVEEKKRLGQAIFHKLGNNADPKTVQQLKEKFPQIFDL